MGFELDPNNIVGVIITYFMHHMIRPTWYPAVSGGDSVIRLGLGELLVNLLQVVKRTNTPQIP